MIPGALVGSVSAPPAPDGLLPAVGQSQIAEKSSANAELLQAKLTAALAENALLASVYKMSRIALKNATGLRLIFESSIRLGLHTSIMQMSIIYD